MKKICTVLTAVMFLSIVAMAQQETFDKTNNIANQIQFTNAAANDNIVSTKVSVLANPFKDVLTLQISNPNKTSYELSLYSSLGKKVTSALYNHPAGISTTQIYTPELSPGIYHLVVLNQYERQLINVLKQ